jgi:hypothetical protein
VKHLLQKRLQRQMTRRHEDVVVERNRFALLEKQKKFCNNLI